MKATLCFVPLLLLLVGLPAGAMIETEYHSVSVTSELENPFGTLEVDGSPFFINKFSRPPLEDWVVEGSFGEGRSFFPTKGKNSTAKKWIFYDPTLCTKYGGCERLEAVLVHFAVDRINAIFSANSVDVRIELDGISPLAWLGSGRMSGTQASFGFDRETRRLLSNRFPQPDLIQGVTTRLWVNGDELCGIASANRPTSLVAEWCLPHETATHEELHNRGVNHSDGICGSIISPVTDGCERRPMLSEKTREIVSTTAGIVATMGDAALYLGEGGRFKVETFWDTEGEYGVGLSTPFGLRDSGFFTFFSPQNVELSIKVLDGCEINNHFWVFFSATTNVGFDVWVTDSDTGAFASYKNPLGVSPRATTDTEAFATCP